MIIGVCQGKGGTGKSTTALNISHSLANKKKKVLIVDLDPQRSLTFAIGGQNTKNTIADVIFDGLPVGEAITQSNISNLDLLVGSSRLANFDLQKAQSTDRNSCVKDVFLGLQGYDFIILDSSPTLSLLNIAVINACDNLLIPVKADYLSIQSLAGFLQSIDEAKNSLGCKAEVIGFLPVMIDRRLRSQKEILKLLTANFGKKVFQSHIPNNVKLAESPSHGKTIFEYAPSSLGAIQYEAATKELIRRLCK